MPIERHIITDRQWSKIEPHCLGKKSDPGRTGGDARLFREGVFWIARTGAQWRDLPAEFGKWNSVYRRFRDWGVGGVFERIFNALTEEPDMEMAMIDGTIVKVHRPLSAIEDNRLPGNGTGLKRGTQSQAIGKSKGGWTTKILALTDALGNLVRFVLLPGHRFDTVGVAPLIEGITFDAMLAPSHGLQANHCRATDKAFDSNWIIADMNARGALICISQRPQRLAPMVIDPEIYKCRHLIENFFMKLKEFKRIAMRADKTDTSFKAMIYAVAALINSR